MHLSLLLEMASEAMGDRAAVTDGDRSLTYSELRSCVSALAERLAEVGAPNTVHLGVNSLAVPVGLFASAAAGTVFTPLNYRLSDAELRRVAERAAPAAAIVDGEMAERIAGVGGLEAIERSTAIDCRSDHRQSLRPVPDPDAPAVMLFTSGTTGEPKAAVLRHRHVSSYVFSTLDFASAGPEEATLVSVPPYHIAGISAIVSSAYVGRRVVYLPSFEPEAWVRTVAMERITHAMVVPTMLGRVLDILDRDGECLPTLRHLAYGGGRMPVQVIERALETLPDVDFVNAYGLTETSSTISVLAPDHHRAAVASDDTTVRDRLGSVGRPHGEIEVSIRDDFGREVEAGQSGEIWVRGPQVSGEYEHGRALRDDGWFRTNDGGHLDADGFLYVEGRLDDVIVRGGENISPGEIEEVLRQHGAVADAAVFGEPSEEWGERIVAVVVPLDVTSPPEQEELRRHVAAALRSTKAPERIVFEPGLPYSETGKLQRRLLVKKISI